MFIQARLRNFGGDGVPVGQGSLAASVGAKPLRARGTSISTMAIAIGTTSTTTTTSVWFVEENRQPFFTLQRVYLAYLSCRKAKRNKMSALLFEANLEENLVRLVEELQSGQYRPTTSICFYTEKPKCREIIAADFRDRVVHHLLYNALSPQWEKIFIHHSYACRPGKGTHNAATALQKMVRQITCNSTRRAFYVKLDIHNFFMSIDKSILLEMLLKKCRHPDLRWLLQVVVLHDPVQKFLFHDREGLRFKIAPHKSLFHTKAGCGLPIGNLTSQFFANVYLNALDQFIKHELKIRYYMRYVDDVVLLHENARYLQAQIPVIANFIGDRLRLELNKKATKNGRISAGVDFVGFIVRPTYILVRRRTLGNLQQKLAKMKHELVQERMGYIFYRFDPIILESGIATLNSYIGHLRHANAKGAFDRMIQRHPFLDMYFCFDGKKFINRFALRKQKRLLLCQQIRIYQRLLKDFFCIFEIGCYFEIFGKQAKEYSQQLGLRLLADWRGWQYACGFHKRHLPRILNKCIDLNIPVVIIQQTGREHYRTMERRPVLLAKPIKSTLNKIQRI